MLPYEPTPERDPLLTATCLRNFSNVQRRIPARTCTTRSLLARSAKMGQPCVGTRTQRSAVGTVLGEPQRAAKSQTEGSQFLGQPQLPQLDCRVSTTYCRIARRCRCNGQSLTAFKFFLAIEELARALQRAVPVINCLWGFKTSEKRFGGYVNFAGDKKEEDFKASDGVFLSAQAVILEEGCALNHFSWCRMHGSSRESKKTYSRQLEYALFLSP